MLWLDAAANPEQVAVARYADDVKLGETTWSVGPFDTAADVLRTALDSLDVQQTLW